MTQITGNVYRWKPFTPIKSFAELKAVGIERVIDLETGVADIFHESNYEHENPADFGIEVVKMPWSNVMPPSMRDLFCLFGLLVEDLSIKTLIRCYSHVDRTGAVALFLRVECEDWSFDKAHAEFVAMGRHWWFFWWKWFLRRSLR